MAKNLKMDWRRGIFFRVIVLGLFASATAHAQQPGTAIFAANCAGCHGADGRGGEHAPNIAGAPAVQQLTDAELAGIVHNGIAGAGMPAFLFTPQQITDVVTYLRILQGRGDIVKLPGDPVQGKHSSSAKPNAATVTWSMARVASSAANSPTTGPARARCDPRRHSQP